MEKTAVADCASRRRFEVTEPSDEINRPFLVVETGSLNAEELEFACKLAGLKVLERSGTSVSATFVQHPTSLLSDPTSTNPGTRATSVQNNDSDSGNGTGQIPNEPQRIQTTPTVDQSPASGGLTIKKLRELNELKRVGLITEKEFQDKRKALISAM
jgi:hypothetical protein